ncbi:hypothetical protein ABT354_12500 [Streptomyces sp. NPDC000594]|uniref:hypothetical protein n=1 Tax=Streptomyces sp. NPDC000594 TaxID=3154261 RepID=UPI0033193EEE
MTVLLLAVTGSAHAMTPDGDDVIRIGAGVPLVTFYEDEGFQGQFVQLLGFPCDQTEYPQLHGQLPAGWNDRVSSFRTHNRCTMYGYEHTYQRGATFVGTAAARMLPGWNDRLSSVMFVR